MVSFTTKYVVPRQIKPRILKLSIGKKQQKLKYCLYFLLTVKKKIIIVSFRRNSSVLTSACLRTQPPYTIRPPNHVFAVFLFIFFQCASGNIEGLGKTKLTVSLGASL